MKLPLIPALLAAVILSACSGAEASPRDTLLQHLDSVAKSPSMMFGHHDDTAYGHTWRYEPGRSDIHDLTGRYPALMNWDLGMIELGASAQLDSVPFSFIREQVAAQAARGGVSSFSWHPRNPISGGDSWDCSTQPLRSLASDAALRDTMTAWIGRAADFIASLKDSDGNPVAVIFRPWHELTGSWFWWGQNFCTPDQYRDLWALTRQVFDSHGATNVVWCYSPDKDLTYAQYMERYPGDELVDVMGVDVYHFDGQEGEAEFIRRARQGLDNATRAAREHGKLAAFAETGSESIPQSDWYTRVLLPILSDYPSLAYVCVWRNAFGNPKHFYTPYKGHPAEADFKSFIQNPLILSVH